MMAYKFVYTVFGTLEVIEILKISLNNKYLAPNKYRYNLNRDTILLSILLMIIIFFIQN